MAQREARSGKRVRSTKIGLHNLVGGARLAPRPQAPRPRPWAPARERRRVRVTRVSRRARATTVRAAASRTSRAARCRSRVGLPKRGFTNPFREENQVVRLDDLPSLAAKSRASRSPKRGLIRGNKGQVKVLANGEISQAVTVKGLKVSAGAREKIVAAGGRVEE